MTDANIIYNYGSKIARELAKIKEDPFNAEIILKFYRSRVAEGISQARILKCLNTLRLISESLAKRFEEATKDDLIDFIGSIEQRNISPWTKRSRTDATDLFQTTKTTSATSFMDGAI